MLRMILMRRRPPERSQLARERKHQIFTAAQNGADTVIRSFRIEFEGFGGTQQGGVVDVDVATRAAPAHQHPDSFGATLRRKMRRCEELLHLPELFIGSGYQAHPYGPFRLLPQFPRIQRRERLL